MLPTGELIVWSIADGRRGRRWREVASLDGRVVRSVLLETNPAGRLTRLEVAAAAGLLTLHPDAGETALHGNVVMPAGIRHLTFAGTSLMVQGSPAATAIAVARVADGIEVGATMQADMIGIDDRLEPRVRAWAISRIEPRTWRLVELSATEEVVVRLDEDSLPILAGEVWPLEI
ncbi:MAG: hypothetical protein ABI628_11805 [Chloroflexota bacterium]